MAFLGRPSSEGRPGKTVLLTGTNRDLRHEASRRRCCLDRPGYRRPQPGLGGHYRRTTAANCRSRARGERSPCADQSQKDRRSRGRDRQSERIADGPLVIRGEGRTGRHLGYSGKEGGGSPTARRKGKDRGKNVGEIRVRKARRQTQTGCQAAC